MITTLYEPFRHWSEGGSVFILSDLHFDDEDCKLMDQNWITPEEQIDIINKMVCKGDTFVCLGDVGNPSYVPMIKARKKILLLGNHDSKGAYKGLFNEIYSGPLFISDKILLSHEPVYGLSWCLNIHGHDHNNMESYKEGCKHINLAANVCGYTPVNLGKIIKEGVLSDIDSIHRITIDRAVDKKKAKVKTEVIRDVTISEMEFEEGQVVNVCLAEQNMKKKAVDAKAIEIAKALLSMGKNTIGEIAKATGLPIDVVKGLAEPSAQ